MDWPFLALPRITQAEKAMPFAFDTVQAYRRAVHLTHELIDSP